MIASLYSLGICCKTLVGAASDEIRPDTESESIRRAMAQSADRDPAVSMADHTDMPRQRSLLAGYSPDAPSRWRRHGLLHLLLGGGGTATECPTAIPSAANEG